MNYLERRFVYGQVDKIIDKSLSSNGVVTSSISGLNCPKNGHIFCLSETDEFQHKDWLIGLTHIHWNENDFTLWKEGFGSEFPEEGWRKQQPKLCDNNN